VDFILKNKQVIALEVKTGASEKTSGMASFKNHYHPDKMLLIDNQGLTWQDFLMMDPIGCFD
jgi:hypothetical protein